MGLIRHTKKYVVVDKSNATPLVLLSYSCVKNCRDLKLKKELNH